MSGTAPTPMLVGFGIAYRYTRGAEVLRDINIEIEAGEIMTLLGPNGSGKSTLLRVLAGLLPITAPHGEGRIRYQGTDLGILAPSERAARVAYVGSELNVEFPITALEVVQMGRIAQGSGLLATLSQHDRDAAQEAMMKCLCWGLRERHLHTLSGGERQLVALARALMQGAKVLLLDESLSKMDLHHQAQIGGLLRKHARDGGAVALVSHDFNVATEWADACYLMHRGEKVASGPVATTLTSERLATLYPGAPLSVAPSPLSGAPKIFFEALSFPQKL